MLLNVHVKNLALIDEVEMNFSDHLNILTGETGAGKSVLMGAVNMALGGKVSKVMIRKGADYALAELFFSVSDERVLETLKEMDIPVEEDSVIISRRMTAGRSVSRINGEIVSAAAVRRAGQLLMDIHGQHDHQSLLDKSRHQVILDRFIREPLGDKKEQLADCIYLAERMNELVRTLLELAKLDSGSARLRIENVQAEELIRAAEQAALAARPQAEGCFSINIEDGLMLRCDRKWFQQALVNVLVNALDYSPAGSPVQITIKQSGGVTILKVLDHSGGVAAEELPNLFKRFYRAKGSRKDGFGIGLSMAQSIVSLHKGNLRAVNEGDGLAMTFTLPQLPCAEPYENRNLTTS